MKRPRALALLVFGASLAAVSGGCRPGSSARSPAPQATPPERQEAVTHAAPLARLNAAPLSTLALPPANSSETADNPEAETIRFRDVSESTHITFVHASGRSPDKDYPTLFGSGVAMLDYDGDGWLDLYFASNRALPLDLPSGAQGNRLYRNRGDGTFLDQTEAAGVAFHGSTNGLAVGDFDANGWPDLYLANFGRNVLFLNNGDGTFTNATAGSGAELGQWSSGAAPLDFDGDGHLDLYISCYGKWTFEEKHPFCGNPASKIRTVCSPVTIPPERHFLLRNLGGGKFEDATRSAGLLREDGRGLGVVAADLNLDGRIDLFVANDLSPNFLFLNRGDGRFDDLSEVSGAACSEAGEFQSGMGVDAQDLNGDGLPELVVSHYRGEYCTLYRNLDGRNFQDVSAAAGIIPDSLPYVGWGCALADFDNDGEPDLLVVNGHVEDNLSAVGQDVPYAEPARVWRNLGQGRFRVVRHAGSFFETDHVARGAAFGDLDNDGDLDLVVSLMDARPVILRNESNPGRWLRLELLGTRSNRSAIGARVEVHAGGRVLHRQVKGGGSYYSASDPRLLIGVGRAIAVDAVEVRWPSGARSRLERPALGQTHRVREPDQGGEPSVQPVPVPSSSSSASAAPRGGPGA
jgi:enediyne biosynthesis protein E4